MQKLESILSGPGCFGSISFDPAVDDVVTTRAAWHFIARIARKRQCSIAINENPIAIDAWLQAGLSAAGIVSPCYLSVGTLGAAPWCKVDWQPGVEWLQILWRDFNVHEAILLSTDKMTCMGLLEEEHEYQMHIFNVSEIGSPD